MTFDPKTGNALEPNTVGSQDCEEPSVGGRPSTRYDYIPKNHNEDTLDSLEDLDIEVCEPWYYHNTRIGDLQVDENILVGGDIDASGTVTASEVSAGGITLTSRKPFDIPHPTKSGYRLRHVCLEGPESGVYYRGRLTNSNVIDLPEYWVELVDPESITVTLTQIGSSQDLIVEKIEWGRKIVIKSGNASAIDCYFMINGERKDGEKLIVEYEGTDINDYPGDNSIYSINK